MTIEAVIDLDREPVEPEPPIRDVDRPWRRWRRPVLAVVSVGLLASLVGADAAATPVASRMEGLTLTASHFEIDDGSLVVTWPSGFGTVHRLPSGEQVGSLPSGHQLLPGSGRGLMIDAGPVTRVTVGVDGLVVTEQRVGQVTVTDPDGAVLWSAGGSVIAGDDASELHSGPLSAGTGVLPVPLDGEPLMVEYDREWLTVRDAWTGEVRARGPMPEPAHGRAPDRPFDDPMVVTAAAVRGVLAVTFLDGQGWWTSAYDPATLAPLWRQAGSPTGGYVERCGDLLCLRHPDPQAANRQLTVLDPATADELWSTASDTTTVGDWLLLDDRMLVEPATGEELLDLTGWQVHRSGPDGKLLVGRWVTTHTGSGERAETVLAEVSAGESPEIRVRGRIPARVHDCAPFDGGVVCRDKSSSGAAERPDWAERLGVWQF